MESRDGDREEASSEAEKPLMWLLCFCVYDWVVNFIGGTRFEELGSNGATWARNILVVCVRSMTPCPVDYHQKDALR